MNDLYLYTWRLPYYGIPDQESTIVIYNYAPDRDRARHYVQLELHEIGGQKETIDKLSRGEIYPTNSFLTDEVGKPPTVRVYIYNKLPPAKKITETNGTITSVNDNIWHRGKLYIDKAKKRDRMKTGLKFKEYTFQDNANPNIHYIVKSIVTESNDYMPQALEEIAKKFSVDQPTIREVKVKPGELTEGVSMAFENKSGILDIVRVTNLIQMDPKIIKLDQIGSFKVQTYGDLKVVRETARKDRKRIRRQELRKKLKDEMGDEAFIAMIKEKNKSKRDRRAEKRADEASGKTPAAQRGAPAAAAARPPATQARKGNLASSNEVDFGIVPSKYRV